jgi:hypothetical protein
MGDSGATRIAAMVTRWLASGLVDVVAYPSPPSRCWRNPAGMRPRRRESETESIGADGDHLRAPSDVPHPARSWRDHLVAVLAMMESVSDTTHRNHKSPQSRGTAGCRSPGAMHASRIHGADARKRVFEKRRIRCHEVVRPVLIHAHLPTDSAAIGCTNRCLTRPASGQRHLSSKISA